LTFFGFRDLIAGEAFVSTKNRLRLAERLSEEVFPPAIFDVIAKGTGDRLRAWSSFIYKLRKDDKRATQIEVILAA